MSPKPKRKQLEKIAGYSFIALLLAINPSGGAVLFRYIRSKSVAFATSSALMLAIASMTGGLGIRDYMASKPLELQGQSIMGTIVSVKYVGKNQVPYITYQFMPVKGKSIQGEGIDWTPIQSDRKVAITYLPNDPEHNLLTEDLERREGARLLWNFLTPIFIIAAAILLRFSFYYRRFPKEKVD